MEKFSSKFSLRTLVTSLEKNFLKTSHRERQRDPIPSNNLLLKLSHLFHPPKFHTFRYLHYEPPGGSKNNPPAETKRQWTSTNRQSLLRATMSQHLGPGQSYGPFLNPRFPSVSDQAERFLADSLSFFFLHFHGLHRATPE